MNLSPVIPSTRVILQSRYSISSINRPTTREHDQFDKNISYPSPIGRIILRLRSRRKKTGHSGTKVRNIDEPVRFALNCIHRGKTLSNPAETLSSSRTHRGLDENKKKGSSNLTRKFPENQPRFAFQPRESARDKDSWKFWRLWSSAAPPGRRVLYNIRRS